MTTPAPARALSPERIPDRPPEHLGRARDDVRLVVTTPDRDVSIRFTALPRVLGAGDLVVVNDSATLPASLPVGDGTERLHLSTPAPAGEGWIVEVRTATRHGSRPALADHGGRVLDLPDGGSARLRAAYPQPGVRGAARLWRAELTVPGELVVYLRRHGRPIRYGDPAVGVPLTAYQTMFARRPGSAEMPSAARPFTPAVVRTLRRRGVGTAAITLHTGVSSPESGEPPFPERFHVPTATAARIAATRRRGGRVIAIGTTVARALETVAVAGGRVRPARGWTEHVIGPGTPIRAVDGLLTGWHEAGASHLDLLAAVGGDAAVARAYELAHATGIRWHEFGDSHLLLPARPALRGTAAPRSPRRTA